MTIWNYKNAPRARVFEVETKTEITQVVQVDDFDEMALLVYQQPLRIEGDEIATEIIRFRSIYPIFGGEQWPQLFLCFGRITQR